ncbi:hypothetical protein BJ508DRAFT_418104 [Ascobolus immersus RN42]|uniref:pH-response regulator protein palC n=1 Tax=Ascobolus immersus RN42 TaxID=1160509 RepID=A0A3N4HP80_ASCIM|nr:hypothetical protein BJ508DRAFT_418104 [Ascobolus immersus RN42]
MPFQYTLPTTSAINFTSIFTTSSPGSSLLDQLTNHRASLRSQLKDYKRTAKTVQKTQIETLFFTITDYYKLLKTLLKEVEDGTTTLANPQNPFKAEWSPLASVLDPSKAIISQKKPVDLDGERRMVLILLSITHYTIGGNLVNRIFDATLDSDQKPQSIKFATSEFTTSSSIFTFLAKTYPAETTLFTGLAHLSLAEANYLCILNSDPYPSYLTLSSDEYSGNSRDWLYNPPEVPSKGRCQISSKISKAAADLAEKCREATRDVEGSGHIQKYCTAFAAAANAKACRFQGIHEERDGEVGTALGWIMLAQKMLAEGDGIRSDGSRTGEFLRNVRKKADNLKGTGMSSLSKNIQENAKADPRNLEAVTCFLLEKKWRKQNDTVGFMKVPDPETLRDNIPPGLEAVVAKEWDNLEPKPEEPIFNFENMFGSAAYLGMGGTDSLMSSLGF